MLKHRAFFAAVVAAATAASMSGQAPRPTQQVLSPAPTFMPDSTFKGSSLAGDQPVGGATWTANNGEITGTPTDPAGGWLMLSQPYQDVQFYARFKCDGPCNSGVLLRATKTPAGTTGMFVSLKEGDLNSYKMTLDASGKEISRELMGNVTYGTIRTGGAQAAGGGGGGGGAPAGRGGGGAPPAGGAPGAGGGGRPGGGAARAGGGGGGGGGRGGPLFTIAGPFPIPMPDLEPPQYGLAKQPNGAWDQIQIIYDSNIVRPELNYTNEMGPAITDDSSAYGPIYLYVGGTSPVHFKDVSFKDLAIRTINPEKLSSRFREQRLEEFSYAWGAAVADFNKDGHLDITAGPYIYYGPDFTKREELYLATPISPSGYPPNMVTHVVDVNGDGWPDILATESRALALYINPGTQKRRWQRYPDGGGAAVPITGESSVLHDLNGDGRPEVIGTFQGGVMGYASYDPANPMAPWKVTPVSPPGTGSGHGAGVGDVNGDGRLDILGAAGWSEQPPNFTGEWKYHPVAFGRWGRSQTPGGGEIFVYDVNGDGLADVVTSLNGHGWGLAWYEQKKDAAGTISFTRHMIMDNYSTPNAGGVTFAELHAVAIGDIDGDGVPDIVTGKRYWSHQDSYFDPDSYGDPVLYWYRTVRDKAAPGGARFVPELIHNRSGVGSQLVVTDLNKDGALDIVTATNRGTFIFFGKPGSK
jgi:hypothetical protein